MNEANTIEIQGKVYTARVNVDGLFVLKTQAMAERIDAKRGVVAKMLGLDPPPYPRPPLLKMWSEMSEDERKQYLVDCEKWATPERVEKWQKEYDAYQMSSDPANEKLWAEHDKLWLDWVRVQLVDEDISALSFDKILEGDQIALAAFFVGLLVRTRQRQLDGSRSSNGTGQTKISQPTDSAATSQPST